MTNQLSSISDYSRIMMDDWIDFGNFDVTDEYVKYIEQFFTFKSTNNFIKGLIINSF